MRQIKFRAWRRSKYEIGSDGSIWSNDFNNSGNRKELKKYKERKDDYRVVWLTIKGVRKIYAVRKLVAEVFLGERPKGLVINHKNGVQCDDRAENLEYVTQQYNTQDGWNRGRKTSEKSLASMKKRFSGENNPKAKLNHSKILSMFALREKGLLYKDIAKHYGISVSQCWAVINKKFWV